MQWNPVNSDVITSASNPPITSSVITHGSPTPPMEDGPPSTLHNNTDFMNGPVDKSFQVSVYDQIHQHISLRKVNYCTLTLECQCSLIES